MLTVQNYRLVPKRISFKANEAKENTQEKTIEKAPVTEVKAEKKPFKTHAGLKLGLLGSGFTIFDELMSKFDKDLMASANNEMKRMGTFNLWKRYPKLNIATTVVSILLAPAIGNYIDTRANKKHAQLAKDLETKNKKEIMEKDTRIRLTDAGNPYYKSNNGLKVRTLYGAAVGTLVSILGLATKTVRPLAAISYSIVMVGLTAVDGLFLDWCSNRAAKKHADRQAAMDKVE